MKVNLKNLPKNKISAKPFCSKYPYILGNIKPLLTATLKNFTEESDLKSFPMVYNNFIISLYEKDFSYLKEICEPRFFHKLEARLKDQIEKLYITTTDPDDIKINTSVVHFKEELCVGVSTDRNKNVKDGSSEVPIEEVDNMPPMKMMKKLFGEPNFDVKFYVSDHLGMRFVMRRVIDFKSNLIISDKAVNGFENFEVHSIILEEEFKTYKKFMNAVGNGDRDIRVVDIDNMMGGNPLV
jgi:hypothetical protein